MFLAQFSSLSKILKVRKMYFCFSSTLTLVSQGFGLFYICMASHMSYWNGSRTIDMCFLKKNPTKQHLGLVGVLLSVSDQILWPFLIFHYLFCQWSVQLIDALVTCYFFFFFFSISFFFNLSLSPSSYTLTLRTGYLSWFLLIPHINLFKVLFVIFKLTSVP